VADHIVAEGIVVAPQEPEDRVKLRVAEGDPLRRVSDEGVHLAALEKRLAVGPAEDVAPLLVYTEPPRGGVESGSLEPQKYFANEPRVRAGRPPDGFTDTDDRVVGRAAGKRRFLVSRG
jgi:hypothetical protein